MLWHIHIAAEDDGMFVNSNCAYNVYIEYMLCEIIAETAALTGVVMMAFVFLIHQALVPLSTYRYLTVNIALRKEYNNN